MRRSSPIAPDVRFERFYQRMDVGCWNWTGGVFKGLGYGKFYGGRNADQRLVTVYAHRFSWTVHVGPIPTGLSVLHHCDNRLCVRPSHLFLGTQLDNMRDMIAKGRARPRGIPFKPEGTAHG